MYHFLLLKIWPLFLCILEEKTGSTVKTSESSSTESQSGQSRATAAPGAGFPGNPFDFSNMAGLLNVLLQFYFIRTMSFV